MTYNDDTTPLPEAPESKHVHARRPQCRRYPAELSTGRFAALLVWTFLVLALIAGVIMEFAE